MKVSVLDLLPLREGESLDQAYLEMVDLARFVETLGYERFWIGEHHNTKGFASTATLQLMQYVLSQTKHIRVGSGGVMLPNHSPLVIAEQLGTLSHLYPNRVDAGLGRAPGTDPKTARALRRQEEHPTLEEEVRELADYFRVDSEVAAYPAQDQKVPFFILGASKASARLAAKLGRPYVFAAHFAPKDLEDAIAIYRAEFQPSIHLTEPYVMVALNMALADQAESAEALASSQLQMFADIVTNRQGFLKAPMESLDRVWDSLTHANGRPHFGPLQFESESLVRQTRRAVENMFSMTLMGDADAARAFLEDLAKRVAPDEILVTDYIYDINAKKRSYEILAEVVGL